MTLTQAFSLREEATPTELRVWVPGGTARRVRLVTIALVLMAVSALSWAFLEADWQGTLFFLSAAALLLAVYEPFEIVAKIREGRLAITMKPRIYNWLGAQTVNIESVTGTRTWLPFVILTRPTGEEYLFVPLPHLSTADGETSNQRIAEFVRRASARKDQHIDLPAAPAPDGLGTDV